MLNRCSFDEQYGLHNILDEADGRAVSDFVYRQAVTGVWQILRTSLISLSSKPWTEGIIEMAILKEDKC